MIKILLHSILVLSISGCAGLPETVKKILGTSTETLEEARVDSLHKTYNCSFDECYEAVLTLTREYQQKLKEREEDDDEVVIEEEDWELIEVEPELGLFDVFMKNRIKGFIVVMGIKGNVDTTEVGIFFDRLAAQTTRIEITSLASSAKRKVAEGVFNQLDINYSQVDQ